MLTGEQDRILRQVLRLVDISGDLDRNKVDGDFVDGGGTILSVVDENIFEMFVRPSQHRQSVETFYADIWSKDGRASDEWHSFEAQAALITAEFILSGPGGEGTREILMTDHHRWELASRIESLTTSIRQQVGLRQKSIRKDVENKFAIVADLEHGKIDKAKGYQVQIETRLLEADLRMLPNASEAVKERVRLARVSAEFFANDPVTGPLDQLRRIASHEMRSKLSSVQVRFDPTQREMTTIETDAERWFERLAGELRRPGHKDRVRAQFAPDNETLGRGKESFARSLLNDARSIALVQWAARRLSTTERIVLITGDPVMFDAYRRWHIEELAGRQSQPFVLRRAIQYTPIFNPYDTGGDLAVAADGPGQKAILFTLIQQAIEAALVHLPVTMKPSFGQASDSILNLTRERLALKVVDQQSLSDDPELGPLAELLTSVWINERALEIQKICESWQESQRVSIGASIKLITCRIGADLREKAQRYFAETAEAATAILSGYAAEVLDKLVDDSIQLWVPLAERFDASAQASFDFAPRTYGAKKRFEVALGASASEISPKTVFTQAACRGLEMQDITNANRFATLALRADRVDRLRQGTQTTDADLLYLQAVTLRFLISTVDTHLRRSRTESRRATWISRGVDQVKRYYGQASALIDRCLVLHADEAEYTSGEDRRRAGIRLLRALSERASLNLFMSTSLGLADRVTSSPLLVDSGWHLQIARGDLSRCVRVDLYEDDAQDPVLMAVRDQYIPNLAAYEVLAYILAEDKRAFVVQQWSRQTKRQIRDFWRRSQNIHPLLEAEYIGYFVLTDETSSIVEIRRKKRQDAKHIRLPLDRELYRTILEELPAKPSA